MSDALIIGTRFFILVAFQVLILKNIDINFASFQYFHLIVYPAFIILLPVKTSKPLVILLAFTAGMCVDLFYDSPGIHASAATLIGFMRPSVLKLVEPVEGFGVSDTPGVKTLGFGPFLIFAAIMLFVYLLFYFSVEAFSFLYLGDILLRTIFSFIVSIVLLVLVQLIFRI
jgi:hypothetical protein